MARAGCRSEHIRRRKKCDNWTGGQNVKKENKFIQIKLFYSSTTTIYSARQRYLKQSIRNEQGETFIEC